MSVEDFSPPLKTARNTNLPRQALAWRFELSDSREHKLTDVKVQQVLQCTDDAARRLILGMKPKGKNV